MGSIKKAEHAFTDSGKFPIESCRERLARRFGIDAVALSGPCEGKGLVDCICNQLDKRWDKIKGRFAGNENKVHKLAISIAESYMQKDDTNECVSDLQKSGFDKCAAEGIAQYLKAYAMDMAADMEVDEAMDKVDDMDDADADMNDMGGEDNMNADKPEELPPPEHSEPAMGGDDGMVTISIPVEMAKELNEAIENMIGDDDLSNDVPPSDMGMPDGSVEVIELEPMGDMAKPEDVVPGEPDMGGDKQVVETEMASHEKCSECGAMASTMRAEQLTKVADTMLHTGPEMSINNTDQLGGHDDKKLGTAKEKGVEEPKALEDGNVKPEGHTAGDGKFQDGKTMGNEEKFDAKPVDKASTTGGKASIMGKDESYPDKKPEVPAGSAPIGGEKFDGGNVSTKGTVIATITPNGILIETDGKKVLAKRAIKPEMVSAIQEGLAKVEFQGDAKKYASALLDVIKKAETSGCVDNVTKTDTAKLEGDKFTNDADKKPEGDSGKSGKGAAKAEEVTTTDNSKKEAENFQNDADKKPEKDAGSDKETKTAKAVEEPKALEDGNVKPEGYTANDSNFKGGKPMGHEEKFDAKTVDKSEIAKGSASLMGSESLPEGKADVPAGGGKMGNEEFEGGNVSTKGTVIAKDNQEQKRAQDENMVQAANEAKTREARLEAAAVYCADALRHGEISEAEFAKELGKVAKMPVQAIQNLIASTKKTRERVAARSQAQRPADKSAGLSIPIVITASNNETLKEKLVKEFKLTKNLDMLDEMGKAGK